MSESKKKRKRDNFTLGSCASIRNYVKVGRLGEGTYGIVYQAMDRITKRVVALKRCIPHHQETDGFPQVALREIAALRLCASHPNIVNLETIAVSKSGVFLVLEYCEHDVAHLLDEYYARKRSSPFSIAAVKTLMKDLLSALDYCHQNFLIHRDVKLSNLLYNSHEGLLKLADFGLSRSYSSTHENDNNLTLPVASLWYRPPELLLGVATTYTQSIDLWACGCVMTELIRGCPCLNGINEQDQMELIVEHIGVFPRDLYCVGTGTTTTTRKTKLKIPTKSPRKLLDLFQSYLSVEGLRLLTGLLDYHPRQRLTAAQALASPFFGTTATTTSGGSNSTGTAASTGITTRVQLDDPPKPLVRTAMPKFPIKKATTTSRSTAKA